MPHTLKIHSTEQPEVRDGAAPSSACRRTAGRDYTANSVAEFESDELTRFVSSPERALSDPTASVVKRGRSALVVRVDFAIGGVETPTAYKRCGSRTRIRRLVRGVRTSAALRNFRLGHRLLSLGIETPRPLIAVSPRWHNLLQPSFLATEWIEGAVPLDAFARSAAAWAPARRRRALCDAARQLGRLIGTLHKHRYSHRDLKSANLLVRERDRQIEAFLIDLDGASRSRLRLQATRLKNLSRLHAATCQTAGVTPTLRCRFFQSYLATLGGRTGWKTVWRQLQKTSKIPPPPMPQPERRAG
jgi:tRNA A-37 threonylcarbamoyl transferase component Bud32